MDQLTQILAHLARATAEKLSPNHQNLSFRSSDEMVAWKKGIEAELKALDQAGKACSPPYDMKWVLEAANAYRPDVLAELAQRPPLEQPAVATPQAPAAPQVTAPQPPPPYVAPTPTAGPAQTVAPQPAFPAGYPPPQAAPPQAQPPPQPVPLPIPVPPQQGVPPMAAPPSPYGNTQPVAGGGAPSGYPHAARPQGYVDAETPGATVVGEDQPSETALHGDVPLNPGPAPEAQ